jgi:hypothetical protein
MPALADQGFALRSARSKLFIKRPSRINDEQTPARFPAGTPARIDAVLAEKEKRADLIRNAVEREIKRREKQPSPKRRPKP